MKCGEFWRQVKSLLIRNMIVKGRIKKQMITEILWPILFIIILALIKFMAQVSTVNSAATGEFPVRYIYPDAHIDGVVLVVPENASTYMQEVLDRYLLNSTLVAKGHADEESAANYYRLHNGSRVFTGVLFHNTLYDSYTIRTNFLESASPLETINHIEDCRPDSPICDSKFYISSGFLVIQWALSSAIIERENQSLPQLKLMQMPKASFIPDSSFIRQFAPVYYVYIYSFFIQFLVVGLVHEKQTRLKEILRIMGMSDAAFWLSWTLLYLMIILSITAIAVVFATLTTFLRPPSNMFIFFLMLSLYGCSIINLAFIIAPFLNSIQVAGPVAVLATTAVSSLFVVVSLTTEYDANGTPSSTLPLVMQWFLCLSSPTALSIAIERAIYLDVAQIGLTWDSLYLGDFPLVVPITMLAVDSLIYFVLSLWLDNVVPGEFGKARHLCYCFDPTYWRSRFQSNIQQKLSESLFECVNQCEYIEPVPEEIMGLNKLRLFDIRKTYKISSRTVEAVRGITLDIYENEITCILGHNGAGKTTLMNMLTGLTSPSSGTALVYGLDIRDQNSMREMRKITGLCPQYDVLVDNMTCKEHLVLYASLKGLPPSTIPAEVEKILREIDLADKADSYTKNLSGGQKRKLSVGIAFLGNPKIIFLDEPSAGMDPKSRRHLWSLLKSKKYGRIILLSTHFMDEADILADRKAIVSKGKLRCCGSSLYLKANFGIGYNLNLTVHPSKYKAADVELLVADNVPGGVLSHSHGMEVCFSLPLEQSDRFADLFRKLEETISSKSIIRATELGIMGYGISMTTLEEVFLRLAEIAESEEADFGDLKTLGKLSNHKPPVALTQRVSLQTSRPKRNLPRLSEILKGFDASLKSSQFHVFVALARIRFFISVRDKMATFSRVILPAILILIAAVTLRFATIQYKPPEASILLDSENTFKSFEGKFAYIDETTDSDASNSRLWKLENMTGIKAERINQTSDLIISPSYLFGIKVTSEGTDAPSILLIYNDTWIHSLPMLVNLISNVILSESDQKTNILTYSQPWGSIAPRYVFHGSVFTFSVMIGFAIIFLPSSFAQAAVHDRTSKAKSQLRIAGLQPKLYWLSVCAVDWSQYMAVGLFLILSFFIFQLRALIEPGAILATVLFLLLYLPIYMLSVYVFSYGYDVAANSQGLIQTSCILLNILFFVPVGMTAMSENDNQRQIADTAHIIFSFINPFYSASGFFMHLLKFDIKQSYTQQSDEPIIRLVSYFLWENRLLPIFLAAVIWLPLLIFLLRLVDALSCGKSMKSQVSSYTDGTQVNKNPHIIEDEDEDVAAERERIKNRTVNSLHPEEPVLIVENLHKSFMRSTMKSESRRMVAVKNLSFQVMPGEVLGLLGPNGAGKSTTMNMLTAEITPDAGMISTGSTNIHTNLADAYKQMGYCPQFDAVWPDITIREHLAAYSIVRGYHPTMVKVVTEYFIELLQLFEHADKQTKTLSGGTKRKLSFAMAMLGNAKVVLLDEPSTGMDPQSKRVFWDAINHSFVGSGRGAILTTHYMEEADALCHRLGIMINGQLVCLGTTQHLKTRFGSGYQLEVKLASTKEARLLAEMDELHRFIFSYFPSSHILEQFGPRVAYKISAHEVTSLARSFQILELAKTKINIGEYNFSQATLEQVFLEFAKYQTEETNTSKERDERSRDISRTRMVSAMHSKVNSTMTLPMPIDEEEEEERTKAIGEEMHQAIHKYALDIKAGMFPSRHSQIIAASPESLQKRFSSDDVGSDHKKIKHSDDLDSVIYYGFRPYKTAHSSSHFGLTSAYIPAPETSLKPVLKPSAISYKSLQPARAMSKSLGVKKMEVDRSSVKFDVRTRGSESGAKRPRLTSEDILEDEEPMDALKVQSLSLEEKDSLDTMQRTIRDDIRRHTANPVQWKLSIDHSSVSDRKLHVPLNVKARVRSSASPATLEEDPDMRTELSDIYVEATMQSG